MALAFVGFMTFAADMAKTAEPNSVEIATGQAITPTAARGAVFVELDPKRMAAPDLRAGKAQRSPRTLAILSSGFPNSY